MKKHIYKAKTLSGAERRVRELMRQIDERDALLDRWKAERVVLAKLACEEPQFFNLPDVDAAYELRDRILKYGQ